MTRDKAQEKYRWDLTSLFANDEEYDVKLKQLIQDAKELKKYEGKLSNADMYLEFLNKKRDILDKLQVHSVYSYLKVTEDTSNKKYEQMDMFTVSVCDEIDIYCSFENKEIVDFSEKYVNTLLKDERFKLYHKSILRDFQNKDTIYVRGEDEEVDKKVDLARKIIHRTKNKFTRITTKGLSYQPILDKDGNKVNIDESFLQNFAKIKDKVLLKNFVEEYYRARLEMNKDLTKNYLKYTRSENYLAKVYGYKSILECKLDEANIDKKVFDNVVLSTRKSLALSDKCIALIQDVNQYKTKKQSNVSYEESFKTVLKAMKVYGKDYLDILMQSHNDRWIDVYPAKYKRPGAFNLGAYLSHPFVELNHEDRPEDVYTLAHELGHAVHSELSRKSQSSVEYHAPIFLCEIASTTNEIILSKYLLKNAKTTEEKLNIMQKYLTKVIGTVYNQIMFTEFELEVNNRVNDGKKLTQRMVNGIYYSIHNDYLNSTEQPNEENALFWDSIEHFYTSFYCYTYATGFITASILANKIIESPEFAQKYLDMLKKGGSEEPLEMLKKLGVDLSQKEVFKSFFKDFDNALNEFDKLIDTFIAENVGENEDNSAFEFKISKKILTDYLIQKMQKENPDKEITEKDVLKETIDQSLLESKEFMDYFLDVSIKNLEKLLEEKTKNKDCNPKELESMKSKLAIFKVLQKTNQQTDEEDEENAPVNADKDSTTEVQQTSQPNQEN